MTKYMRLGPSLFASGKVVVLARQFDIDLKNLICDSTRSMADAAGGLRTAAHIMSMSLAAALVSVLTAVDTPDAVRELVEGMLEENENGDSNEHDRAQ